MIQSLLMISIMTINFLFLQLDQPLSLGLVLLIQTVLISLLTGMANKTFWFSYILFLVFLGGMLILFIYVVSLASNEKFSLSTNYWPMLIMFFVLTLVLLTADSQLTSFFSNEMTHFQKNILYPENSINLIKLYNYPMNYSTVTLILYLLITLIAVVKITNSNKGPLRMMN